MKTKKPSGGLSRKHSNRLGSKASPQLVLGTVSVAAAVAAVAAVAAAAAVAVEVAATAVVVAGVGVAVAVVVAARSSSLVERRFVVSRPSGLLKVAMGPPLLLRPNP